MNIASDVNRINNIAVVPRILEHICAVTGMGFSAIARVTENKWVNCSSHDTISFGLRSGDELDVKTTISGEIMRHRKPVAIDHVEKDPVFHNHPTPIQYGFKSFISVPILKKNGEFFGTLSALNPKPAEVSSEATITNFTLFADLIACHLDSLESRDLAEKELKIKQEKLNILDTYVGVLSHDLRNPLATARMSAEILLKLSKSDLNSRHANMIKSSSYRLENMIQNIVDFSRIQMGLQLELPARTSSDDLKRCLEQALKEIYVIAPDRQINSQFHLKQAFECDPERIGQLFSNLLKIAERYGAKDSPIEVLASCETGEFLLKVSRTINERSDFSELKLSIPSQYSQGPQEKEKLNLEIYIASEIAKAHRGSIDISTSGDEFTFVVRI